MPSAPSAAERSPEPETGETAETEADQEVAEARKVALQAAEAADALKAAREDWLKQFDLSMVNPPPSSPVDIADADHRELTRRERITLLERGLAGEKFSGPPDDENSELRIAEAPGRAPSDHKVRRGSIPQFVQDPFGHVLSRLSHRYLCRGSAPRAKGKDAAAVEAEGPGLC